MSLDRHRGFDFTQEDNNINYCKNKVIRISHINLLKYPNLIITK